MSISLGHALAQTSLYAENQEGAVMIEEYRKVVEEWKEQVRMEGEARGEARGEAKGLHEALNAIYLSRFGPLSDAQQQTLRATQATDRLRVWVSVFVRRPKEEIDRLLQGE